MEAQMIIGTNKNDTEISPYIFGNFVEDMKDHMDGMLAFIIRDMNFERIDSVFKGVSSPWHPFTDGKNTSYELQPAAPMHTGCSQRVKIYSSDKCYAGVEQKVFIKKDMVYNVKINFRTSVEIKFIDVGIYDISNGAPIDVQRIKVESHDWKDYKCILHNISNNQIAIFRITTNTLEQSWDDFYTNGMFWIDYACMIPQDSAGIIRKEVFEMTRDLNCGIMRLGGNQISSYHFKHYLGDWHKRPSLVSEAWEHWTCKEFGTDEYIDFCRDLDVVPQICVNAGSGTAKEAAEWVEYCNGDIDTKMGKLRAENGNVEPYNIKYWEIGNEMWGLRQVGRCTANEYGMRCREFAKAMKKVSPDIKILACGHYDNEWNKAVLKEAHEYIDYLTFHYYHALDISYQMLKPNSINEFKYMVSMPESMQKIIDEMKQLLASQNLYKHIEIGITEYNIAYPKGVGVDRKPDQHTLECAIGIAGALNTFIRNSEIVKICNFSDLVNGWDGGCIRSHTSDEEGFKGINIYGTPAYYVLKMYAGMKPKYLLESHTICDYYELPKMFENFDSPLNPIGQENKFPVLDTVTCLDNLKKNIIIYAVNRSDEDIDFDIQIESKPKNVDVYYIGGQIPKMINSIKHPENLICCLDQASVKPTGVKISIKSNSIYAVKIGL